MRLGVDIFALVAVALLFDDDWNAPKSGESIEPPEGSMTLGGEQEPPDSSDAVPAPKEPLTPKRRRK
jgi:hypothetical protein